MSEHVKLAYRAPSMQVRVVRLHADAFRRNGAVPYRRRGRTRTWELELRVPEGLARLVSPLL